MTLDAMDWVWKHSQSRGNPRIALLAVADRVRTPACEVRVSWADLMQALNVTSKAVVSGAVKSAVALGELQIVEAGKGTRPALYRLPKAVGYVRGSESSGPDSAPLSGPDSGPQGEESGTESGPLAKISGPDSAPLADVHDHASGPESVPEWSGICTSSGPESVPHYQPSSTKGGSIDRSPSVGPRIPDFATELVREMTTAGMAVTWQLSDTEWFKIHAHLKRCPVPFIVAFTRDRWNHSNPPQTARYLTRIWDQMPDAPPAAEPGLPALRVAPVGPPTANQRRRDLFDTAAARLTAGGTQ